ncbi:MAG: hypothetical protein ACLSFT_02180 [Ruminococcus callidus]
MKHLTGWKCWCISASIRFPEWCRLPDEAQGSDTVHAGELLAEVNLNLLEQNQLPKFTVVLITNMDAVCDPSELYSCRSRKDCGTDLREIGQYRTKIVRQMLSSNFSSDETKRRNT